MSHVIDLLGQRFGRLTVVSRVLLERKMRATWSCQCDCGNQLKVTGKSLRSSNTQSCGCLKRDTVARLHKTHGESKKAYYQNWKAMMMRCYNANSTSYPEYGGRGIKVCEFLRATPSNLLLLLGERPQGRFTIDRISSKLHYTCGQCSECLKCGYTKNVRWATYATQNRNHSRNRLITFEGKTQCLTDWATEKGIKPGTLFGRLKKGLTLFENHRQRLSNGRYARS